jgi:hypothetical protein
VVCVISDVLTGVISQVGVRSCKPRRPLGFLGQTRARLVARGLLRIRKLRGVGSTWRNGSGLLLLFRFSLRAKLNHLNVPLVALQETDGARRYM